MYLILGMLGKNGKLVRRAATACALLLAASACFGQSPIRATNQDGRVVYTNDGPSEKSAVQGVNRSAPAKQKTYVYWSSQKQRWIPIQPSPRALSAARDAASDVTTFVDSRPQSSTMPAAPQNPNYAELSRGRQITSAEIDRAIADAAAHHNVDPNLVRAIIQVESAYNPHAVSPKGARGLMQLMPETARRLNVTDVFDPAQNVDAGVRHLKHLLENFGGDLQLSLAAYNAGETAVARSGGIPPYPETRNYVGRITSLYSGGMQLFPGLSAPIHVRRDQRGVLTISNTD